MKSHKYKAVIFDLDGSLVDSMWMWHEIDIEYPVVGVWPSHRKPNIKVDSTTAVMLFFSPLSHRNAPFLPFHFHIPSPDML